MGKCDKSLKHPVLHRAFLPGVSLQHSAPVFQLKYAPYSLLSREYYTCFPAKAQGKIWDLFCLKNSIVKCNNFLLIFLYILSHHNKAVNIHSFVGSLL